MPENPWQIYSPDQGKSQEIQIGPLQIHLQWVANEVWVAYRHTSWPGEDEEPATLNWWRWALNEKEPDIELVPVMPPLPLLFKPEEPYRLLPGAHTRIYTRIPLWVRVRTVSKKTLLTEIPTVRQSNTWFGTTADGELCFSHYSSLRRFVTDDFFLPHLVGTILEIKNASTVDLNFVKICLRTDPLSIFSSDGHLWADATTVTYKGSAAEGDFHVAGKPPSEAAKPKLISGPRVARNTNLAVRTFDMLRDIRLF